MLYANENKVIIEVIENNNVSDGGIIIPDQAVKTSNKGVVVESDVFDEGTVVYFRPYAGFGVNHEGRDYLVVLDEDILAYFEPESDDDSETGL